MAPITILLPLLAFIPYVAAHGFVANLNIAGKSYPGQEPAEDDEATTPGVIRRILTTSPVKGSDNLSLNCGMNSTVATESATVAAGSAVELYWQAGGGANWPHNTGPIITYLANCGNGACDTFDATTAKWFKISQVGLTGDSSAPFYQQYLMSGSPSNTTIPSNLAPGNYIMRHEIIALHNAISVGGAEFYPSCSQLTVTGSGTGAPTDEETVSFPGAYSDTDPGIYSAEGFYGLTTYSFPGPPIAAFVSGSSSSSGGSSVSASSSATATGTSAAATSTSATKSSSSSAATASAKSPSTTGTCKLKKQTTTNSRKRSNVQNKRNSFSRDVVASLPKPRHISRVMARIIHGELVTV